MKLLICAMVAIAAARAQTPRAPHVHAMPHGSCQGEPDHVYGKQNGVYYACVKGKEMCSRERAKIPAPLIAEFDKNALEHEARTQAYREKLVREGRIVERDPAAFAPVVPPEAQARVEVVRAGAVTNVVAAANAAPPPPPVAESRVREIALGTDREDVTAKLGEPYMRISGVVEVLTYRLSPAGSARLEFSAGKLSRTQIVR
jgi:hypothetical protein